MTNISKINANYKVSGNSETMKMEGNFTFGTFIENMNVSVESIEGMYLGNVNYQERIDGNTTLNCNLPMQYMMDAITLLNDIVADIYKEMTE